MNNVDEKLKFAFDMVNKDIIHFTQFNYLYPFTTENINGYLDNFDLKDRSLLTVGSSSDQVLNAILCGCKDITVYDICPYIKEYYYLKMAAIKTLTMDEYLKFFSYMNYPILMLKNINTFDNKTFKIINEYLKVIDEETSYFWSELFNHYKGRTIRKKLFNPDECTVKTNKVVNRYLKNDEMYNMLKNNIDGINSIFICDDIFNTNINKKYDNIWLSNILAYYNVVKYIKLFNKMKEYLPDDGKMLVSYLYNTDNNDIYIDDANSRYSKEEILKTLNEMVEFITFRGKSGISVHEYGMTDSIITYTKSKKI